MMKITKKTIGIVILGGSMALSIQSCKKCQTCKVEYSYEYEDTDSEGNTVTQTESGTETSDTECAGKKDLQAMEEKWNQEAEDLKSQLESTGAKNVSTNVSCTQE